MKTNKEDLILVQETLAGNLRSFTLLVNRHKDFVYTICVRMLKNNDAEEVAQDVFLKIYHSLKNFKGESKLSTWIYKITYRKCLDKLKKQKREHSFNLDEELMVNNTAIIEDAFNRLVNEDRKKCINNCLVQLSAEDNLIITLFYYKELTLEEIAEVLNIKTNNTKVKLFRARKKLAKLLEQQVAPEILHGYEK